MNSNTCKFSFKFNEITYLPDDLYLLKHLAEAQDETMAYKYQLLIQNIKYSWRTWGLIYRVKVLLQIIISNDELSLIMIALIFPEHKRLNLSVFIISCDYINLFKKCLFFISNLSVCRRCHKYFKYLFSKTVFIPLHLISKSICVTRSSYIRFFIHKLK